MSKKTVNTSGTNRYFRCSNAQWLRYKRAAKLAKAKSVVDWMRDRLDEAATDELGEARVIGRK